MNREEFHQLCDALTKRLSDEGRLIEVGWLALRRMAVPADAPDVQVNEMRMAYMCGAQHLFSSIMNVLDPGQEPTDRDMLRIEQIHNELEAFRKEMELRVGKMEGHA